MADVTMDDLMHRTSQVIQTEVNVVRSFFLRNDVHLITGTAHFTSPNQISVKNDSGEIEISSEKIILAPGSRPHVPVTSHSIMTES